MSRKDFEAIARAVRNAQQQDTSAKYQEAIGTVALLLASECAGSNPRFDRARFLAACGVRA